MSFRTTRLLAIAAAILAAHVSVLAQSACRSITIVVGYPPGGSVDAAARALADGMASSLGCSVIVENVGGASGAIGVQKVVNAQDGSTILFGSSSELVATKILNPQQKYDAARDLTPIAYVGELPLVLLASPKLEIDTLTDAIARIRKNPGALNYGTSGVGSVLHLSGEYMKQLGALFITHIPYKGATSIATDLASGQIDLAFLGPGAAKPFIESGRAKALAVTSPRRLAALPQVPSLTEYPSLKGYDLVGWYAVMAPLKASAEEKSRLAAVVTAALRNDGVRQRLERVGVNFSSTPVDLSKLLVDDEKRYRKVVQFAGIKD